MPTGSESQCGNLAGVVGEAQQLLPREHLPDADNTPAVGRSERPAVRRERHGAKLAEVVGNSARQQTTTQVRTCGDVDFGDQEWTGSTIETILYARAQQTYGKFTMLTTDARAPESDGLLTVMYPGLCTEQYTFFDTIHWPESGGMRTIFFVLDHEFGHRLRDGADGTNDHWNWDNVRFIYGRQHEFTSNTGVEGFAFHEGWAEYFNGQVDTGLGPDQNVPDGKWTGPPSPSIEGFVANQLLDLSNRCGGFANLWSTLKANPGAIHSLAEFNAKFFLRNPQCIAPRDGDASINVGAKTPVPLVSLAAPPSKSPVPDLVRPFAIAGGGLDSHLAEIRLRSASTGNLAPQKMPTYLPQSSHVTFNRLALRNVALTGTFSKQTADAYQAAVQSLAAIPPESWVSSEATRRAALDGFATGVLGARLRLLQDARRDVQTERKATQEPGLAKYLDDLDKKYASAEAELQRILSTRASGEKVPAEFLPKALWGQTATPAKEGQPGDRSTGPLR